VPMTSRVRDIIQTRRNACGKTQKRLALSGYACEGRPYCGQHNLRTAHNAVEKIGWNPREFVLYALRHRCLTRWGDSGMNAWTLARLAGRSSIKQSIISCATRGNRRMSFVGDKLGDNQELRNSNDETNLLNTLQT
jgi:hypothetical protein